MPNKLVELPGHGTFWFLADEDDVGPLAYLEHCNEDGEITRLDSAFSDSYAHVFDDGQIKRYGQVIGTKADLTEVGPVGYSFTSRATGDQVAGILYLKGRDMNATKESIKAVAEKLGLSMTTEFVPWSLSRNAGEKQPSLNWKVTLHKVKSLGGYRDGLKPVPIESTLILTTDYGAGCAHCPSYKQGDNSVDRTQAVKLECETGRPSTLTSGGARTMTGKPRIEPDLADVLHSLASDSDVLDHPGFESWAADLGYDTDSRKAEAIYRACLDIGLKLRNALGEDGLKELREAVQDY